MSGYDRDQWARDRIAELQQEYYEKAKPYVTMLMEAQSLRPPAPVIVDINDLPLEMLEELKRKGAGNVG